MMRRYRTHGVCARYMDVETDGESVIDVQIHGGCGGQRHALPRLVRGMRIDDVVKRLRGTPCRNGTSCADQLARILEQEKEEFAKTNSVIILPDRTHDGCEDA